MARAFRDSVAASTAGRYQTALFRFEMAISRLALALHAGYRPDQPRVPAGSSDGGQWTRMPGWARGREGTARDNLHLVGGRPRGGGAGTYIAGRWQPLTPAQQTRLAVSQMEMEAALRAMHEILPNWKPHPQAYWTVEGLIGANMAQAREARTLREQWRNQGIGYGRFSADSREARNSGRRFTREERDEVNRIGREFGCHTCGTFNPGTISGNFYIDHQIPTGLLLSPARQSLLPHCMFCSARQGGVVRQIQRRR